MSNYEQRDMNGSAFVNDKRSSDSHPHFKGTAMIGGIEYWFSVWKKKTKAGDTYLSSSFQVKEPKRASEPAWGSDPPRATAPSTGADFDDEIPF